MISYKCAYAVDLALLYDSRDWKAVEDTLSEDIPHFQLISTLVG